MDAINERISQIIRKTGLSKTEFAKRINVSQQYVSKLSKDGTPSDRTITDICREFYADENWLRTGEGEMFTEKPETKLDELAQEYSLNELDRQMILGYLNLNVAEREAVKRYMQGVLDRMGNTSKQPAPAADPKQPDELGVKPVTQKPDFSIPEGSTPEIEAELARMREEMILEKSMKTSRGSTPASAG